MLTSRRLDLYCFQVLNEVVTYHNQAPSDEVKVLLAEGVPDQDANNDIHTQM